MKLRKLDNFKRWRDRAKEQGLIKSSYPELEKNGDLAELIGVVLGDGNITSFPRCECLRIVGSANNPGFAKRYAALVERVLGKRPHMAFRNKSNAINLTVYEKYISKRLRIPTGARGSLKYRLPAWIRKDRAFRIRFLRGLYEAEGSECHHLPTSTHKLFFSNKNKSLLTLVSELVQALGFKTNTSGYIVQVSRQKEVQDLANLLEFRHYDL